MNLIKSMSLVNMQCKEKYLIKKLKFLRGYNNVLRRLENGHSCPMRYSVPRIDRKPRGPAAPRTISET